MFSLAASRSNRICFVTAHSQWTTTASWPDALHLRQPRLVNNLSEFFYFTIVRIRFHLASGMNLAIFFNFSLRLVFS